MIETIIGDELEKSHVPGLAVGIVQGDKLAFVKCHGYTDVEGKIPITPATAFHWASISKLFTCIGIFQQWEENKFKLNDPVNHYLSKGKLLRKKQSWPEVTFEHLLTHTAGIGELRRGADLFRKGFRLLTYDEKPVPPLSTLHDLPLHLSSPAGKKYAYSNIGGSLLGFLTEIFSGEDFQAYMIQRVLDPLGMVHSDFDNSDRVNDRLARGYKYKKGTLQLAKPWHNIIKPSGGLVTPLDDMVKFAACLLRKGKFDGKQLLKPETLDLIWTPHYWAHESLKETDAIGYIFRIQQLNGKKILWHTGGMSGFTATLDLIPGDGVALLTEANLGESLHSRITFRLRHRILKVLTGATDAFDPSRYQPDTTWWPDIKGHYGGYPGWLSNTRVIVNGIDFKVQEKDGHLVLSSLFGEHKNGTVLYPTADPLVYEYPRGDAGDIDYTSSIGFTRSQKTGKVIEMSIGDMDKLRKNPGWRTFRFTISMLVIIAVTTLSLLAILDLFTR